jgi:hypothetical protein
VVKKAGIVAACAAVGIVGFSPMAFGSTPSQASFENVAMSSSAFGVAPTKKKKKDDDGDDNSVKIASGNAIQIGSVQNGACNVNVGNDALNIGSPHKNKVNQKKSCNAKNTVKGG